MKTELKQENLSIRQKLGMVKVGHIYECHNKIENLEYALKLIRNHSLGAIGVEPTLPELSRIMKEIHEAADFTIRIVTDAEEGIGPHLIGKHSALGCTGSDSLAYIFGKVTLPLQPVVSRSMASTVPNSLHIRGKSKKKALKPNGFKANLWWGRMGSNH